MDTTPHDMIMKAHELTGREVTLYIDDPDALRGVTVRLCTIEGVSEAGGGYVKVTNYRPADGHSTLTVPWTLVGAAEIIDIRA